MDARDARRLSADFKEKSSKFGQKESSGDEEHDHQRRASGPREMPRMDNRRSSIDPQHRRSLNDKLNRKVSIDVRSLKDETTQERQSEMQSNAWDQESSPTDKDTDRRPSLQGKRRRGSISKSLSQENILAKGGPQTGICPIRSLSQLSALLRKQESENPPKQSRATALFSIRRPSAEAYRPSLDGEVLGPLQRRLTPPVIMATDMENSLRLTDQALVPQMAKDRMRPDTPDGTSRDCRGLRFSPAALVFKNVFKGERRALRFVLQNVSQRPLCISVLTSSSLFFCLKKQVYDQVLAPGLKHDNVLTMKQYSWRSGSILNASLTIVIDGIPEEYTIEAQFAAPLLEVEPAELDFGVLNVAAPVVVRYLTLRNVGHLPTSFAVDPGSDAAQLTVRPLRGKLQAHSLKRLRCEFAPSIPGDFIRAMWVRGGGSACRIPVTAHIVHPRLQIIYPFPGGEGKYVLLNFGPVYYGGKDRLVTTVHNCSSEICTFVVMAEMPNGKLMTLQDAHAHSPKLRVFGAHPSEGRIQCMETRIFTFG